MKSPILLLLVALVFTGINGYSQKEEKSIHEDSLLIDFELLEKAFEDLHPGLTRFQSSKEASKNFKAYKKDYSKATTLKQAFLKLSQFTATVKCGHTYPNFWNQSKIVQDSLFNQKDKLPFTFVIVEDHFLIQQNVSDHEVLEGAIIKSINGTSTSKIIHTLLKYTRGDGSNDAKRVRDLSLTGYGKFEAFDVYFPLLFPPKNGVYEVAYERPSGQSGKVVLMVCTRAQRTTRIKEKYGIEPKSIDDLWNKEWLDKSTAYLQLGDFAVWKMKMDWKAYLSDFFKDLADKKGKHLIIDIRGNEGGLAEVYWELLKYLHDEPMRILRDRRLIHYKKVREELRPYLSSYDQNLFDRGKTIKAVDNEFYTFADTKTDTLYISPAETPFTGELVLLIDAANSSATYHLAKIIKQNGLGTLIGETTGGNLKGTNGSEFFMLQLPYSGLEVDLPLVATVPRRNAEDSGYAPNILQERTIEYYRSETDEDIERALQFFREGQ